MSSDAERRRKAITLIVRACERNGLTPFDLLSWISILNMTRFARGEKGVGMFESHELQQEIDAAAERKADLLDAENMARPNADPREAGFHRAVLKGFLR